jgi:hypothetical protein
MLYTTQQIQAATIKNGSDMIRHNIASDDRWLLRAIIRIYENQTNEEKSRESTDDDNGIGFTGLDAKILSSFAKQIIRHQNDPQAKYPVPLSHKQMSIARKKMGKYSGQLLRIVRAKAGITRAKPTRQAVPKMEANGQLLLA